MSDNIINFKIQKEVNDSLIEAIKTDLPEFYKKGLYITTAVDPNVSDYLNFNDHVVVSGNDGNEILLTLPEVNLFKPHEMFRLLEAINASVEFQYDNINGKGSFKKELSNFFSEGRKGNIYNLPEPVSVNLLSEAVDSVAEPLKDENEEKARLDTLSKFPLSLKSIFYNSEYLNNFHNLVTKKITEDEAMKFAGKLIDTELKIKNYAESSANDSSNILANVLKLGSLNKGFISKDFNDQAKEKSLEELKSSYYQSLIDKNYKEYKVYGELIDDEYKKLILIDDSCKGDVSSSLKFQELNRVKTHMQEYIDFILEHLSKKAGIIIPVTKREKEASQNEKEFIDYSIEKVNKANDKCLAYLVDGIEWVDENIPNISNSDIDPNMPDMIKDILMSIKGEIKESSDTNCECIWCSYVKEVKSLC